MTPYYEERGIVIYHGDCRDVLPSLDIEADLLVTDPPYGIEWKTTGQRGFAIMQGDRARDEADIIAALDLALRKLLRPGCGSCKHVYIFGSLDLSSLPLGPTCELIWDKGQVGIGDLTLPWAPQHERITFGVHVPSRQNRIDGYGALSARIRKGSVINVPRLSTRQVSRHPTEKPVLLLRQLIESSSVIGDLVLDPFAGSGSTLEAARIESRRAIGIEIEERYCEVAARRLAQQVFDFSEEREAAEVCV